MPEEITPEEITPAENKPTETAPLSPRHWALAGVACAWVAAWQWVGRDHMLDDALIHLRYAHNLRDLGMLTFNGDAPNYGTSSLAYAALLAALSFVSRAAAVPKVLSVVVYGALLVAVARRARRAGQGAFAGGWSRGPSLAWWGLFVAVLAPSAQRWLTDGMETGLAALAALAAAELGVTVGCRADARVQPRWLAALFAGGFAVVVLRFDLLMVAGCTCLLMVAVARVPVLLTAPPRERARALAEPLALGLGALAALATLALVFGTPMPDTGIAKQTGAVGLTAALRTMASATAGALLFGAGVAGVWAVSLVVALRTRRTRLAALVGVLPLTVIVALVALRGVQVQGIRHELWALLFSAATNLALWRRAPGHDWQTRRGPALPEVGGAAEGLSRAGDRSPAARAGPWLTWSRAALAVAVTLGMAVDAVWMWPVITERAQSYRALADAELSSIRGKHAFAADIGFFAWYADAHVHDLNGLVNGTALARASLAERVDAARASSVDLAFLTPLQVRALSRHYDLSDFDVVAGFRFRNLREPGPHHFLAVRRSLRRAAGLKSRGPLLDAGKLAPDGPVLALARER